MPPFEKRLSCLLPLMRGPPWREKQACSERTYINMTVCKRPRHDKMTFRSLRTEGGNLPLWNIVAHTQRKKGRKHSRRKQTPKVYANRQQGWHIRFLRGFARDCEISIQVVWSCRSAPFRFRHQFGIRRNPAVKHGDDNGTLSVGEAVNRGNQREGNLWRTHRVSSDSSRVSGLQREYTKGYQVYNVPSADSWVQNIGALFALNLVPA